MSDLMNIVCPTCSTTNRVPRARIEDAPICGKCKTRLFTGKPIDLTAESFPRHIQNNQIPLVVDFWAAWCGPCKMMAPVFAQAATQLEPHVRFAKVDTEAEQVLASQHRVQSIPTIALFRNGREVARQAGAMPLPALLQWVRSHI